MSSPVADSEKLFRAAKPEHFQGNLPGSQVFTCREMRISVDRADFQNNCPEPTRDRFPSPRRVVSLQALTVRESAPYTRNDEKGRPLQEYGIDVEAVPLSDNPGHAEIHGQPEWNHKGVFKKVCERLALLSKVEI